MPEIRDYTSPVDGLAPQQGGAEALMMEGRHVGAAYRQLGADANQLIKQYEEHAADTEINNLTAATAKYHMQRQDDLLSQINDPKNAADPSFLTRYNTETQEQLDEMVSHAQTREGKRYATARTSEIEQQLHETGLSQWGAANVEHTVGQTQGMVNNLVSMTARDPSSADVTAGTIRDSIEAAFPRSGVEPSVRARAVEELTQRALTANANSYYNSTLASVRAQYATGATSSPAEDQLKKDIAAGRYGEYIQGDEFSKLPEMVDQARKQGMEDYHTVQAGQQKADEVAYTARATQISTSISDAIAAGQPITADMLQARDQLVNDPKAAGLIGPKITEINSLIRDGVKAQADHTFIVTNPHTSADLLSRLTLPIGDPRAITEGELVHDVAGGLLSKDDYAMYHQALPRVGSDPGYKADVATMDKWIEGYRAQITGHGALPGGAAAFAQFKHDAMMTFMQWRQSEPDKAVEIMTNGNNPRNFGQMVGEYVQAARTPDPIAALNKVPGYGVHFGAAVGSAVSPILGPTPGNTHTYAGVGGAPGPLDAKTTADMARVAGGN